jgi:alpha-L-fucosidase
MSLSRRHFLTQGIPGAALASGAIAAVGFSTSTSPGPLNQGAVAGGQSEEMRGFEQSGLQETAWVAEQQHLETRASCPPEGAQRLSLSQLQAWEALGYGMFIHFGMGTYFGAEWWKGDAPASTYNPDKLDVDQWVQIARDAGMKYVVLTAKHASGFCLWPTQHTDYNITKSGNKTDVVKAFLLACERRGVRPCLYYGSRDHHNGPPRGCRMPEPGVPNESTYTTSLYQDFVTAQIDELLTEYGPLMEFWLDRPVLLGHGYRTYIYNRIASIQPHSVIMLNHGWPSDLLSFEVAMPPASGLMKWEDVEGRCYYVPGELCIPIGKKWFYVEADPPRPDQELLNLYVQARKRGANLLLNVPPNEHGLISDEFQKALMRLRQNAQL